MIFQEPMTSLNPVHTCGRQVAEAMLQHLPINKQEARKRTLVLFDKVQIPHPERVFDAYPHQLSGGQKQRVVIAMAMSCNPALLIADEPTTALDVTVQKSILQLLKEIQAAEQMGMIFISHDLAVVSEVADKVLVMYKGEVVEQGPVNAVFTNPQHPYTQGLLACRPPLNKKPRKLLTVADFMQNKLQAGEKPEEELITAADTQLRRKKLYAQPPLLEVKDLQVHFPVKTGLFNKSKETIKAVDGVSFVVYPGETLGLVGESGCGKTTTGRAILRLIVPTGGEVLYRGKDMLELSSKAMRSLRKEAQIIFQDPYSSLNPRITIGQAIMEPMQVHGLLANNKERRVKAIALLERVGLSEEHLNRYPHEFSGGQRQRVCIARALALNPSFIICDESVSALDVSVQAQVLNLLNELREEYGFTCIFISHDLSVVQYMSDRMIVMNKGKIEEAGFPEDIYQNPQSAYTQKLIAAIPGKMA
jgi:peptide/nickel transport system ATP-binding protein